MTKYLKNLLILCLIAGLIAGMASCGKKEKTEKTVKTSVSTPLTENLWYYDDRNNTIRSVINFGEDGILKVNYVYLDEERAKRVDMQYIIYNEDTHYYKDLGDKLTGDIKENAEDTHAFVTYSSEEDMKNDKNGFVTYYHIDKDGLNVGGNICHAADEKLRTELQAEVDKNMSYVNME